MKTMLLLTQDDDGRKIAMRQEGREFDLIADVSAGADEPRKLLLKDVMRVGEFVKESEELHFSVDNALLRHWASSFKRMKESGVRVPITRMHDKTGDPDKGYGWVEDMYVEGDRLWAIMDLRGEDAIAAAARSDVSIFSPTEMTDGDGRVWSRPIQHIAMCTDPLITGLGEFKELAAQRSGRKESQMNLEALKKLAGVLKVSDEVTESNADEILGKITAAAEVRGVELSELKASLKKKEGEDEEAKGEDGDEKTKALAATRAEVLPEIIEMLSSARGAQIDAALASGQLDKASADKLRAQFIGDNGAAIAASHGDDRDAFKMVMGIVTTNKPLPVGDERTKLQTLQTSRSSGDEDNALMADAKRRAEEAEAATK